MSKQGLTRGRICFTVDELMKLIFTLNKRAFTEQVPDEGVRLAAYLGNRGDSGSPRSGLDDEYMAKAQTFMETAPGQGRFESGKDLVQYATVKVPRKTGGRSVYDTGAAITVAGQSLQMVGGGAPWATGVGEFLETVGAITAIAGGLWMGVEEAFDIDPGYKEVPVEDVQGQQHID